MSLGEVMTQNTFKSGEALQVKELYLEKSGLQDPLF
jgi:hypothetical protein